MENIDSLNIKIVSQKADEEFYKQKSNTPPIDLDSVLSERYKEFDNLLNSKLSDHLVLFDDGIKTIIGIHEICKHNYGETKEGLSFVILSSKMVGLLLGIRKMIYSGLGDCIKNLNRPLIETIDVFFACLINKELSDSFARKDKSYDNNDFYWKNFAKDKLSKECNKLFRSLLITEEYISFLNNKRKDQRSFLSQSIHSSFNASFASYIMSTIDFNISDSCFGKITTAFPMLIMRLIEDIYIFDSIFYAALDKEISSDFENLKIEKADPIYFHYHVKFELLYANYWEFLYNQAQAYPNFLGSLIDELKNNDAK